MKKFLLTSLMGMLIANVAFGVDIKSQIGAQDLNLGQGTFQRRTSTGGTLTLDQINAGDIPWPSGSGYVGDIDNTYKLSAPYVDVRTFMTDAQKADVAAGTYVVDVSAAVQAAQVNLVNGAAPEIKFPSGKFFINSTVFITWHHTKFRGAGIQNTFIKIGSGVTAFSPPAGSIGRNGIEFYDMDFSSASGTPNAYAFTAPDNTVSSSVALYMKVYRCQFTNLLNVYNPEIATRNIQFTGTEYEGCVFSNSPVNMISLMDKNAIYFTQSQWTGMTQNTSAFWLGGGTADSIGLYFNNCRWDINDREALRFSAGTGKASNVSITDGYFEGQYGDGGAGSAIRIDNSVVGLTISNTFATDSAPASGRYFIGGASYVSPITIINSRLSYYDDIDPTMVASASVHRTYLGWNERQTSGSDNSLYGYFGRAITAAGGVVFAAGGAVTNMWRVTAVALGYGATAANSCEDNTATVTGAVEGRIVALGFPNAMASIAKTQFSGWVSTGDTVTVRRCNLDNSTVSATSGNVLIYVWY